MDRGTETRVRAGGGEKFSWQVILSHCWLDGVQGYAALLKIFLFSALWLLTKYAKVIMKIKHIIQLIQ